MKRLATRFFSALLLLIAPVAGCTAANPALDAINIPEPPGFVRLSTHSPKTFETITSVASANGSRSSRIVEMMVPVSYAETLKAGATVQPDRYMTQEASDTTEPKLYSSSFFAAYTEHMRQTHGLLMTDQELASYFAQTPSEWVGPHGKLAKSFTIHGMTDLGIAVDRPNAIGTARLMTVSIDGGNMPIVVVTSMTFLKGHIVPLKVFAKIHGSNDIQWARDAATKWADQSIAVNL